MLRRDLFRVESRGETYRHKAGAKKNKAGFEIFKSLSQSYSEKKMNFAFSSNISSPKSLTMASHCWEFYS